MANLTKRAPGTTAVNLGKIGDAETVSLAKESMLFLDRAGFDIPCDRKIYVDRSGSMNSTTTLAETAAIVKATGGAAIVTDQNGIVEMYGYTHKVGKEVKFGPNELDKIVNKIPGTGGGTNLEPVIRHAMASVKPGGMPLIAVVITDGLHGDLAATDRALIESARLPVHFVFISVHHGGDAVLDRLDTLESQMDMYERGEDYQTPQAQQLRLLDNTAAVKVHSSVGVTPQQWAEYVNAGAEKWLRQARLGQLIAA